MAPTASEPKSPVDVAVQLATVKFQDQMHKAGLAALPGPGGQVQYSQAADTHPGPSQRPPLPSGTT